MATLEERVSYLEGRVEDQSRAGGDLRELVLALDQKVDRRFEALEQKVDRRFEAVDRRFEAIEQKVDRRFEAVDLHFEALEQKFEHRFNLLERRLTWVIGIQLSTLLTIIVGLLGIIGTLIRHP